MNVIMHMQSRCKEGDVVVVQELVQVQVQVQETGDRRQATGAGAGAGE